MKNTTPPAKLTPAITPISTTKARAAQRPVRGQQRGKQRGLGRGARRALLSLMRVHYTGFMARKTTPKAAAARKRAAGTEAGKPGKPKPWTPQPRSRRRSAASARRARRRQTELQHVNPYTLLVAVVLSAQATDAGVNKATPALFAAADTPEKMVALGEETVRDFIKTIGLYRNKAKNVVELSRRLVAEHGGKVPRDREALEALPGVGRKTANVVLNVAFGETTIAVDTHIFRVGNRTNMAPGLTPFEVELTSRQGRAGQIQAARAPLADPARPLHLRRAQAAVRDVHHQRSVPLAGEDGGLRHARLSGIHAFVTKDWMPDEPDGWSTTETENACRSQPTPWRHGPQRARRSRGHFQHDADAHSKFWRQGLRPARRAAGKAEAQSRAGARRRDDPAHRTREPRSVHAAPCRAGLCGAHQEPDALRARRAARLRGRRLSFPA